MLIGGLALSIVTIDDKIINIYPDDVTCDIRTARLDITKKLRQYDKIKEYHAKFWYLKDIDEHTINYNESWMNKKIPKIKKAWMDITNMRNGDTTPYDMVFN